MKVGIVIGTYNNADYIGEAIASVRAQSMPDWTCLCIDNSSADDTPERIHASIDGDARFRFLSIPNRGPSAWRNTGYAALPETCEYIHFLDGDDRLEPDFLAELVAYLDQHPEVGLVACRHTLIDTRGTPLGPGRCNRFMPGVLGLPKLLKDADTLTPFTSLFAATGQGPFALFRRSSYAQTTGYEPDFWSHEDADIFCQMGLRAEVHFFPRPLYAKRVHTRNLTHSSRANYGKFRDKWDNYQAADAEENARIERALRYYYGTHAPFRHLKVAALALKYTLRDRKLAPLRWAFACLAKGLCQFLFKRELKQKLATRPRAQHPPS